MQSIPLKRKGTVRTLDCQLLLYPEQTIHQILRSWLPEQAALEQPELEQPELEQPELGDLDCWDCMARRSMRITNKSFKQLSQITY